MAHLPYLLYCINVLDILLMLTQGRHLHIAQKKLWINFYLKLHIIKSIYDFYVYIIGNNTFVAGHMR